MVDSYQGSLKLKGETRAVKRRHMGVLMIEDDKIIFMYDNDDVKEIIFEEISQIVHCDKWPKSYKRPEIILKDGRSFIYCTNPGSNWATFNSLGGQIDQTSRIKKGNQLVFKTLTYLLKKYKDKS